MVVAVVVPGAVELMVAQAGGQDAYGALPMSIQSPPLIIPCQPSAQNQGESIRPVEAVDELAIGLAAANEVASAVQSAVAQ
jgi:hypothetical protein